MPQDLFIKAKHQEQQLTKVRCHTRLDKIIEIVNNYLNSKQITSNLFIINEEHKDLMINNILQQISIWEGSEYNKQPDSLKACHQKVRQWWNRGKSFKLGQYMFQPLLTSILKVCDI